MMAGYLVVATLLAAACLVLRAAVEGSLGSLAASVLLWSLCAAALAAVIFVLRRRNMHVSRTTSLVGVALLTLHLPWLGAFGLTDPWETHYGEVAREILARRDAISTFWANDGWFHSKPVLLFWLEAASFRLLGVRHEPGAMLASLEGQSPHPEWAVRLPVALFAMAGLFLLYLGAKRHMGHRAAALGVLITASTSFWQLVSHQAITDIILVGPMCGCIGLLLWAVTEPQTASEQSSRWLRWVVLAGLLTVVLPQIVYLFTRNVELVWTADAHGFRWSKDRFTFGSAGNSHLPGQLGAHEGRYVIPWLQPAVQATIWAVALAGLAWGILRERSRGSLLLYAATTLAAVGCMGKGLFGLALPGVVGLAIVVSYRRYDLLTPRVLALSLGLAALCVAPWYLATIARHGRLFFDELVLRHMIERTVGHLHDTNSADDIGARYYVTQLGYGLFPWIGLMPPALSVALRDLRGRSPHAPLVVWAAFGFVLVSLMGTKFHHYVFPVVPALGLLAGAWLSSRARLSRGDWLAVISGVFLTAAVARDLLFVDQMRLHPARLMHLATYEYGRKWPEALAAPWGIAAFALLATGLVLSRTRLRHRVTGAVGVVAIGFGSWFVTSYLAPASEHWGQRNLFVAAERLRRGVGDTGPIVAYQLNWKGENFYAGGRAALFIRSGEPFARYVRERTSGGAATLMVATERSRIDGLRREALAAMRPGGTFEVVTTPSENQQFALVLLRAAKEP